MKSKFLKPAIGVLGALAFSVSVLSFTNANAKSVSSDEVTVITSDKLEVLTLDANAGLALVSSGYVLVVE